MQAVLLGVGVKGVFPGVGATEGICNLATYVLRAQSPATALAA